VCVDGRSARAATQEAVFSVILGAPPESIAESSSVPELLVLAEATGVDSAELATLTKEDKIALLTNQLVTSQIATRESLLQDTAPEIPEGPLQEDLNVAPGRRPASGISTGARLAETQWDSAPRAAVRSRALARFGIDLPPGSRVVRSSAFTTGDEAYICLPGDVLLAVNGESDPSLFAAASAII